VACLTRFDSRNGRLYEGGIASNFLDAWRAALQRQLPICSPLMLQRLIHMLSGFRNGKTLFGSKLFFVEWAQACLAVMDSYSVQALTWIIDALGRLQLGPADLGRPFFQTWTQLITVQLHLCSAVQLKTLIKALAKLKLRADELGGEVYYAWSEACLPLLHTYEPRELLVLMWSWGTLHLGEYHLGPKMLHAWVEVFVPQMHRVANFTDLALAMMYSGLVTNTTKSHFLTVEFYERWFALVCAGLPRMSTTEVYEVLESLGVAFVNFAEVRTLLEPFVVAWQVGDFVRSLLVLSLTLNSELRCHRWIRFRCCSWVASCGLLANWRFVRS
jgi:hypothetical protein